jgi:FMN phosphatase YigB (HAD superfamily)
MVGDSIEDDVEGARALGMQAVLLDREGRCPDVVGRIESLAELPAALGLS